MGRSARSRPDSEIAVQVETVMNALLGILPMTRRHPRAYPSLAMTYVKTMIGGWQTPPSIPDRTRSDHNSLTRKLVGNRHLS